MQRRIGLIGVPSSAGAHWPGQEKAPAALRRAGLVERLLSSDLETVDLGDSPVALWRLRPDERRHQNLDLVAAVAGQVADHVSNAYTSGLVPVVLGGDCTITVGVVAGLLRHIDDLVLVYFDATPDLNTPADSPTGILDSMGMSHLLGEGTGRLTRIGPRYPLLRDSDVVLFGMNADGLNPVEAERLADRKLSLYTADSIRPDPEGTAEAALSAIKRRRHRFVVHFDVDVMDFVDCPAGNFPQFNQGLTREETFRALRVFLIDPALAGLVVTEFNPDRDLDGSIADALVEGIVNGLAVAC